MNLNRLHIASGLLAVTLLLPNAAESAGPAPDLIINTSRLASSIDLHVQNFRSRDCAIQEECVAATGKRTLLRFDVGIANVGDADLVLGRPQERPELFHFSPCHGHYHLEGFAVYELLNSDGTVAVPGRKQAFCLMDVAKYWPTAGPSRFNCSNQGISVGWQDIYSKYLDCQWLDVTGLPAGDYFLRVTVNPPSVNAEGTSTHLLPEGDYSNNVATVPVTISVRGKR